MGLILEAVGTYPFALKYIKGLRERCYAAADRIEELEGKLDKQRRDFSAQLLSIRNRLLNAVDRSDTWARKYEKEAVRRRKMQRAALKISSLFDGRGNLIGNPEPVLTVLRETLQEINEDE